MHDWGDEWFEKYGKDLYRAENYIYDFTRRWSRCHLMSKEKYGTIRYEHIFPPGGGIFYNHWYSKWWLNSRIYSLWARFGWYVCGWAIKRAVKKWPYLEDELKWDFCANTKFGRECEAKYWGRV